MVLNPAFPILWIMVPNHYSGNDYGGKKKFHTAAGLPVTLGMLTCYQLYDLHHSERYKDLVV